jgi:hypothetical protein
MLYFHFPKKYGMNKFLTAILLLTVVTVRAQNNNLMNYNGHWYAPHASSLDKEALSYQLLLTEKATFDSLARNLDVFVDRATFSRNINELMKNQRVTGNMSVSVLQKDFSDLTGLLKYPVQGNDEYRRFINTYVARVMKARNEGWSDELYAYVMREAVGIVYNFFNTKAKTDGALRAVVAEINSDARYQKCKNRITVDAKMMNDPNMQMFICNRMEYVLGADIYRYRESTPGVVTNYAKRKKESNDLFGWLFQRATTDRANFIALADFNHDAGSKTNEAIVALNRNTSWYIFLFYKGVLYYSDALPLCDGGPGLNIPFKE